MSLLKRGHPGLVSRLFDDEVVNQREQSDATHSTRDNVLMLKLDPNIRNIFVSSLETFMKADLLERLAPEQLAEHAWLNSWW